MPVVTRQVTDLLGDLVRIDSVAPRYEPRGGGEAAIAAFIAGWLADAGAEVEIADTEPGRPNVLATLRGTGGGPTLCLRAHTDTVGYRGWSRDALTPRIVGDHLYGLGAADGKAGCAAAMLTLLALARSGVRPRGDLLVACVADEEGIAAGTTALAERGGIDAAIVVEPQRTDEIVVEHQGFGWLDVVTRGIPAHGSAADDGVDAIVHLAEVITRIHRLDRSVFHRFPSLNNGRTVCHTGMVSGGTDYSSYPDLARVGLEVGIQPGERLADRIAEIEEIFAEVAQSEPGFDGQVVVRLDREPFVASGHQALQDAAAGAIAAVLGREPTITGATGWTGAAILQRAGIPTVLLGSAGGRFHAPEEWASISDLARLCEILTRTALAYLGG